MRGKVAREGAADGGETALGSLKSQTPYVVSYRDKTWRGGRHRPEHALRFSYSRGQARHMPSGAVRRP
jgi:hypothetical protein